MPPAPLRTPRAVAWPTPAIAQAAAASRKHAEDARGQAVARLVEQLRKHPARPSATAGQVGLFLIDAGGRETTLIANDGDEITLENMQELEDMAAAQPLPADHAIVHSLLQNYVLDDGSSTDNPIGLIVGTAVKVGGEVTNQATIEGAAERTAKEIGDQLKPAFQRQGWI